MRTKFALSYAILAMAELEQMALEKYHLEPTVWWRYIDDVFLIWKHGKKN